MDARLNSSIVWQYFHREKPGDRAVKCRLCERVYTMAVGGTTSNLIKHIRGKHLDDPPPTIITSTEAEIDTSSDAQQTFIRPPSDLNSEVNTDSGQIEEIGRKLTSCENPRNYKRKPKKFTSVVWKHFVLPTPGSETCSCIHCGAVMSYSYEHRGSTTNMRRHVERKHPEQFLETEGQKCSISSDITHDKSQNYYVTANSRDTVNDNECSSSLIEPKTEPVPVASVDKSFPSVKSPLNIKSGGSKEKEQTDALVLQMITSDLQSLSLVESEGFRNVVKALNSQYELPSCDKLSEDLLPHLYEEVQQDVKISLQLSDKVAITADSWMSWSSKQYVTLTAHFLSQSWEKKSLVLSTMQISNDLTGVELAAELKKNLMDWEIQNKVCAVLTETDLSSDSSFMADAVLHLELEHVPCFVYALDRMVKKAFKASEDVVAAANRVRAIASYLQYSCDGVSMLREVQGSYNADIPLKKILERDEEDRWMSTLHMIRHYLTLHEELSAALCYLGKTDICILEIDVGIMKKVVETLEPFELAAEELCVEERATLSTVIPMLKQLQSCLSELQYQDFTFTLVLQTELSRLSSSLEGNFTVGASTVLDPRFKYLPFSDSAKAKNIESRLTSMLTEVYEVKSTDSSNFTVPDEKSATNEKSLWNKFDSKVIDFLETSASNTFLPAIELRRYFESRQLRRQEVHPIDWWKSNEALLPNLSKLAQQFLAIPASAVPAKVIFSKASEAFLAKRSCLEERHIDKMIFLNKNACSKFMKLC
ncbi:zinc finger BED domain-containing protein 4 [Aplysia californica]|uniref:Zinc finger BED domain-containing protein 4 n=1 Tax=Aplysia californica TaxID=6500 RepID=A0ABM0JTA0_APLCA|nr:zinc finger BED domain-containing protein 4 [Aplysia californica]